MSIADHKIKIFPALNALLLPKTGIYVPHLLS